MQNYKITFLSVLCYPLCNSLYQPTFEQQYLENGQILPSEELLLRVFNKIFSDIQVDILCTFGSLVIDV